MCKQSCVSLARDKARQMQFVGEKETVMESTPLNLNAGCRTAEVSLHSSPPVLCRPTCATSAFSSIESIPQQMITPYCEQTGRHKSQVGASGQLLLAPCQRHKFQPMARALITCRASGACPTCNQQTPPDSVHGRRWLEAAGLRPIARCPPWSRCPVGRAGIPLLHVALRAHNGTH